MPSENVVELLVRARDLATAQLRKVSQGVSAMKVVALNAYIQIAKEAAKAGAAILNAANAGSKFADRMGDMASKLNVSTELMSTLGFAAGRTGSSLEAVQTGIRTMNRNMLVAAQGSKSLGEVFTRLGVSVTDAEGRMKPTEAVLAEVSEGMRNMTSETERAAIAQTLFGRSGGDLVPILANGAEGVENFRKRAENLGVVIGGEAAANANLLQDTIQDLRSAFLGVSLALGNNLLPAIQPAIAGFIGLVSEFGKFISEGNTLQMIGRAIGTTLEITAVVAITLYEAVAKAAIGLYTMARAAWALTTGDLAAIPRIMEEGAESVRTIDAQTKRFVDAMGNAKIASTEFSEAIHTNAETSDDATQSWAIQTEAINKLRQELKATSDTYLETERQMSIARAEAAGQTTESELLKFEAFQARIMGEQELKDMEIEAEKTRIETTVADAAARDEQLKLLDDIRTEHHKNNAAEIAMAAEEAAASVVASWESTISPVTSTIQQTTQAAIQGELTTSQAITQIGRSMVRTVLNQTIDLLTAELLAKQITEIGKATIEAPGTFGASLLKIPLILAAAAAARGAVTAVTMQEGGLVTGGVSGRDSVPALLEPGELVLPRPVTNFLRGAFSEGGRQGPFFQEGGIVEGGVQPLIGTLMVDSLSDHEYIDRLADRLTEAVRTRGVTLAASEVS